jgi:four helix bundle protein
MAGKITTFEDLIAWQKARELTKAIYRTTSAREFSKDYCLKDQMRRAAVSVMSNIAEGFDRGGRAEFHQFLVIAKASCAELRSQLYIALDAGYIGAEHFKQVVVLNQEVARIIAGLRKAVHRQRKSFTQSLVLSP